MESNPIDLTWHKDIKYSDSPFIKTIKGPFKVGDEVVEDCPYGGNMTFRCNGTDIIGALNCLPAPICAQQKFELHLLKGNVTFEPVYAGESQKASCPNNNESNATIFCNASGHWEGLNHDHCTKRPCGAKSFVRDGIRFEIEETALNKSSSSACFIESCLDDGGESCAHPMCTDGTCGTVYCDSDKG